MTPPPLPVRTIQAEKEHKMNKLTDLVISAGASISMEEAAQAQARKVRCQKSPKRAL